MKKNKTISFDKPSNRFTKITIWIILILTTLALIIPPILPIIKKFMGSSRPQIQREKFQKHIKIKDIKTNISSSEVEKKKALEKIKEIEKKAKIELEKSSKEVSKKKE